MDTIQKTGEDRLPFDVRTLILSFWRRRKTLVMIGGGALLLGVLGGLIFGTRIYEAETVLLYKPTEEEAPSLQTQMNMVKVQPNLAEVRRRLKLNTSLEKLGAACDVRVQHNTNLLIVRNEWDSPEQAAAIANALRDVFVGNQQRIRKTALGNQIKDLEEHLEFIRRQLQGADATQQEFVEATGAVDLDQEVQGYLEELAAIDRVYEQAQVEKEVMQQALSNPSQVIRNMNHPATSADRYKLPAELDGLAEMNTRIQWALNAIQDEKTQRINRAELTKIKQEFERAQALWNRGLISEREYQSVEAAYEKQKALTSDTKQTEAWKTKLNTLMEDRLSRLEDAREKVKARLANLPQMQRRYIGIRREVDFWEAQQQDLEAQLAGARRAYESKSSDFSVVSDAEISRLPIESNRRLLALAIFILGGFAGIGFVFGREVMDRTVKSEAEYFLKASPPLLGILPRQPDDSQLFPARIDWPLAERFRAVACRIRQEVPKRGARILIAGAQPDEGTTMAATNLAACFGRQDERVLLLDAQVHAGSAQTEGQHVRADVESLMVNDDLWSEKRRFVTCDLIAEKGASLQGLGEYLSFEAAEVDEVIWPTTMPGVSCIPHVNESVVPDLVCSNRMRDMLDTVSERFSMVLIDVPPVLGRIDASVLAQWCDGVVFVMRSQKCQAQILQKAVDRLKPSGVPVIGTVLNDVDPLYLEKEREDSQFV